MAGPRSRPGRRVTLAVAGLALVLLPIGCSRNNGDDTTAGTDDPVSQPADGTGEAAADPADDTGEAGGGNEDGAGPTDDGNGEVAPAPEERTDGSTGESSDDAVPTEADDDPAALGEAEIEELEATLDELDELLGALELDMEQD